MADHHFQCVKCEEWEADYYHDKKAFVCGKCGYEEKVTPRKETCFHCRATYTAYTWFDPSGCTNCYRSFVD